MTIPIVEFRSLSDVTDLCEQAMTCSGDIDILSELIENAEDKYRPKDLRGLQREDIKNHLVCWRKEMIALMRTRYKILGDIHVVSANEGGNAAVSDLILIDETGQEYHVETKFGNHTNAAAGIARVSSILKERECFHLSKPQRQQLITSYIDDGEDEAKSILWEYMIDEVAEFPEGLFADPVPIYDMLRSSGSAGNSDHVRHYSVVVLKSGKNGPVAYEEPLNLSVDDTWLVSISTGPNKSTPRLTYHLHAPDDSRSIRMVHNNKNSLYVIEDQRQWRVASTREKKERRDDILRIPSRVQAGAPSYNVWYQEAKPLSSEDIDIT